MIYRIEYESADESSEGFEFFDRLEDALQAADKHDARGERNSSKISKKRTPRSKLAVIHLLNDWAGHPDNG